MSLGCVAGGALVIAFMLALVACGDPADVTATARPFTDSGDPATDCQALLDSGWSAPETDPSIVWDPATMQAEVDFGSEGVLNLDVSDPACLKLPDVGRLLSGLPADFSEAQIEECTAAVADVVSGQAPRKGELVGDLDALRRHVVEWCPARFGEALKQAEASPGSSR